LTQTQFQERAHETMFLGEPQFVFSALLPEYDPQLIREGVRGKYAERFAAGTRVVVLEPDVAAAFPDAAAVNAALRALLDIARQQVGGKASAA
jgi:hypothetical protein